MMEGDQSQTEELQLDRRRNGISTFRVKKEKENRVGPGRQVCGLGDSLLGFYPICKLLKSKLHLAHCL